MTESGVWVYAVGTGLEDPWLLETRGVDGEALRLVRAAELAAVVGTVDLIRFGEEGLRRSLNDLDQLESIARAHHDVVDVVAFRSPVAPTRLATLYEDDDRVHAMLESHADAFRAALRRVAGRREWGVKAYAMAQPIPDDAGAPLSGADYLRRQQTKLNARNAARRSAVAAAETIHSGLSAVAVAALLHRPQDAQLTGDERAMLLNGAYLVAENASDAFRDRVVTMADAQTELEVQLTGPWPPYSFAVVDEGPQP